MKKGLWIFIAIVVILIILVVFRSKEKVDNNINGTINTSDEQSNNEFIEIQEDGTLLNKSEKISSTKTIEGLEISNIKLTEKDDVTEILADVKNTTDKDVEGFDITITILDKDEEIMVIFGAYMPSVEANGTATLNTSSAGNFVNAYDFVIAKADEQE